jgi:hypothetical protein
VYACRAGTPGVEEHSVQELALRGQTITVRLERRAYSPVLRQADLPPATTVPWWGNRTLRYELI